MGRTLYLECASGISGDMVVAALLDAGASEAKLREALDSLGVTGFSIAVSRKSVGAVDACDFDVVLDAEHDGHDHDMAYLYGDLDDAERAHGHHHHHAHDAEDGHGHGNGHCHHHEHDGEDGHHHDHEHCHHHHEHDGEDEHVHCHVHDDGHCHSHEADEGHGHHHDHEHCHHHHDHDHGEHCHHVHEHEHCHHHHDHEHEHCHHHDHAHEHGHDHAHGHHHHHEHRSPADIARIIDGGNLTAGANALAHRIFDIVADAESKAHGVPLEQVHFHEVGVVDSIVDVVAAAVCLDDLQVDDVVVSPLAEGHGRIRCAHGVLNVPVPAVMNIVATHGLVLERRDQHGELVTPTGAAIAAAFRTTDKLPERYRIVATGTGAGKRAYNPPSSVRAIIMESVEESVPVAPQASGNALGQPHLWKLETEVDDCAGEALGHVVDRLYAAGANEAHFLPTFMKKGRPGYQLEVLCTEGLIPTLEQIIFEDTTTIGIRRMPIWRTALSRRAETVETTFGTARVKTVTLPTGEVRRYPEYASVAELAAANDAPYQQVYRAVIAAAQA